MDILLGNVTQQAINYAIRSGIAVTGGYAIKQCARLLQSAPRGSERKELMELQVRLDSKIRIISPAIDMIELIAARGNTSLESAVSLTKEIRWEIQALGVRLSKAANEEELLHRNSMRAKSAEQNDLELRLIISDIRKLLSRIEDAVPLFSLAISTSGVSLTTNLPATISPSRLLQASTFLTAADSRYASRPTERVQIGPTYTLSMYMLFAGHAYRPQDEDDVRETTWKEVIHKARVKLVRVPLDKLYDLPDASHAPQLDPTHSSIPAEDMLDEFAYQLVFIEDLDDERVHTFEENEPQPGPVDDVACAGICDIVPIHQVSKIFYADTGKILNIGRDGEVNNPVLLVKRDIYAVPPRRMMERSESQARYEDDEGSDGELVEETPGPSVDQHDDHSGSDDESGEAIHRTAIEEQDELAAQFRRESFPVVDDETEVKPATEMKTGPEQEQHPTRSSSADFWKLPPNLDPEWIAFEVYNEEPDSEDDLDAPPFDVDPPILRPSTSRQATPETDLSNGLSTLSFASSPATSSPSRLPDRSAQSNILPSAFNANIKTSLSLLEMLIRLTALQQFRQSSHLTIEDELLNFFLEDSATTGAGSNAEYRQRVRRDARRRVGFDPYDESPIKRRGEDYLAHPRATPQQEQYWDYGSQYDGTGLGSPEFIRPSIERPSSRRSTPRRHYPLSAERQSSRYGTPVQSSPSPAMRPLPASTTSSPAAATPSHMATSPAARPTPVSTKSAPAPSTPKQPWVRLTSTPPRSAKTRQAVLRSQTEKPRSPLSFGLRTPKDDSTLGTSPTSATMKEDKDEE